MVTVAVRSSNVAFCETVIENCTLPEAPEAGETEHQELLLEADQATVAEKGAETVPPAAGNSTEAFPSEPKVTWLPEGRENVMLAAGVGGVGGGVGVGVGVGVGFVSPHATARNSSSKKTEKMRIKVFIVE